MQIYLNPKNDVAFRRLFGRESNKTITINLLNSVLGYKGNKAITDIRYLNTHLLPESVELRESIVDILCEDQRKQQYIVELQVLKPASFDKRVLYYASKTYVSQMLRGDQYPRLKKVYLVGILDHIMFPYTETYKTEHVIMDRVAYQHTFKDFEFHLIELPKFNKQEHELSTPEEKWVYFFKTAERTDHIPETVTEPEIKAAYDLMDQFNWTPEERDLYERSQLAVQDLQAIQEQARKEGREEGREEGRDEGEKIGLEKGRKEEREKTLLDVARNMLKQGLSIQNITAATGLSADKIRELSKPANE